MRDNLVDGTDHGRDAHAIVAAKVPTTFYFRCLAQVASPDQPPDLRLRCSCSKINNLSLPHPLQLHVFRYRHKTNRRRNRGWLHFA